MYVIVTFKHEKDLIKNSGEKVAMPFSPFYVYGDFFGSSMASYDGSGRISNSSYMYVIVTCKYVEDP